MKTAVVLVSGGLDSATVLAIARDEGYACYALSCDYGQRHRAELKAAKRVAEKLGAIQHRIAEINLNWIGGSALTDNKIAVPLHSTEGIPVTYVPARNTILLSLALAWAESLSIDNIFIGANAVDYSGYPDCRPKYIHAFENMANLATKRAVSGAPLRIHAPLIELSKVQIIQRGIALSVDFSETVSCYQADDEGLACGQCDSCRIRKQGFVEAGVSDPTRYIAEPVRPSLN